MITLLHWKGHQLIPKLITETYLKLKEYNTKQCFINLRRKAVFSEYWSVSVFKQKFSLADKVISIAHK